MSERRMERQRIQQRTLLERLMDRMEMEGPKVLEWETLDLETLARDAGLSLRNLGRMDRMEDIFFPEHGEFLSHLETILERSGLAETCLAMARHQEEDRHHWLRRLSLIEREPRLRARRDELDNTSRTVFIAHFQRWGMASPSGERSAILQAHALMGVLRGAERLWVEGNGRPILPVLIHEALALVWPALYPQLRK